MQKTSTRKSSKVRIHHDKNMRTDAKALLSQSSDSHRASRDFLANRESIYGLVDIIDHLFDAAIG